MYRCEVLQNLPVCTTGFGVAGVVIGGAGGSVFGGLVNPLLRKRYISLLTRLFIIRFFSYNKSDFSLLKI